MENLYNDIVNKKAKISLVGLGYVGLPIAVAFSKHANVIGFDISAEKIEQYKNGIDPTNEVGHEELSKCGALFTADSSKLREAIFHIVAVPTPISSDKNPNLKPLESASRLVGKNLVSGSVVVYESTVYPGVTEDICVPILEKESGLKCGIDFKVGYSPERINPGDKEHRLENIVKIVSGMDSDTLDIVAKVYELVVEAGVHRAESIKVAEAAKVIENAQRDINIAFMNELAIIFDKLNIDTKAVLKAAGTKWNFLRFFPGLVGGHCIGVDPYYLTYKAEQIGYSSQVILAGRHINDNMGKYVAEKTAKMLFKNSGNADSVKVGIFGLTFKENCPDIRNTRVIDIINELHEYGIEVFVYDPLADTIEVKHEYGLTLVSEADIKDLDALVLAVAHDEFKKIKEWKRFFKNNKPGVFVDVKGVAQPDDMSEYKYWRL
ncbi:MAG: nucleotide sugar dehydrogenase [Oscillospiraceae bacterium]|nr:nucleotide sugar dehydrogenase [Oscillospiraceae bacterium]